MDNDHAFEAEAAVDAALAIKRPEPDERLGKDLTVVAEGGIVSDSEDYRGTTERSPLLGAAPSDEEPEDPPWPGAEDLIGLPWYRTPSVFWLLPIYSIAALAFGGIAVPKINLILTLICREVMSDKAINDPSFTYLPVVFGGANDQCRNPDVQSRVALFNLYANLISGFLTAIVSPKIGALSDRYGRTRILVCCSAGMFVSELITICAATYPETFHVQWILMGSFFEGLCGSFISSTALSNSYAADCTPPKKRAVTFAWVHACLFTGIALGPILAGYLIKWTHQVVTVFYVALVIHIIFILFLAFVVPESLSKRRQKAARERYRLELERQGPTADWINYLRKFNLFAPLKILYPTGPGTSRLVRRNLVLLAGVDTIMFGVAMGALSVIIIYMYRAFGWGDFESARFVSIVNTFRVSSLVILLPLLSRFFRSKRNRSIKGGRAGHSGADLFDLNVIRLAVFMDMIGFVGYAASRQGALFILSGVVASIGGIGSPTLQSALTKHVPQDKVGQLLGAIGLLHALARIAGPTIFNGIYSVTVGKFDQAVFVCLAAAFGVAFIFSWFIRPGVHFDDVDPVEQDD